MGFAVAGGRSERMGRDKALLPWGEATLLDHTLERLWQLCGDVRILSGSASRYLERGAPVIVDVAENCGPLGGVLAGLEALGEGPGLFLAVDIPLAPVALLRRLLELSVDHDVVVPVTTGGTHPLCAIYRRSCVGSIRRRLAAGERKMTCFWPDVRVREVNESELARFGNPELLLRNLNTPEDYDALRER
jgi:molybdopterin-guanine dinucleotide biosynthesis protein A